MSTQTATVKTSPAYSVLSGIFGSWGYKAFGLVFLSCSPSFTLMPVTLVSWDGTKLTIAGTFNAPCAGTLNEFQFTFQEYAGNFSGYSDITNVGVTVMANQAYTIYLVETLSSPTTATFQSQ